MSGQRRVLRWVVPIDDQWHDIGPGRVMLIWWRELSGNAIEVWTEEYLPDDWPRVPGFKSRQVRVYGTGHLLDNDAQEPLGSTVSHGGQFVWHVFARH